MEHRMFFVDSYWYLQSPTKCSPAQKQPPRSSEESCTHTACTHDGHPYPDTRSMRASSDETTVRRQQSGTVPKQPRQLLQLLLDAIGRLEVVLLYVTPNTGLHHAHTRLHKRLHKLKQKEESATRKKHVSTSG